MEQTVAVNPMMGAEMAGLDVVVGRELSDMTVFGLVHVMRLRVAG